MRGDGGARTSRERHRTASARRDIPFIKFCGLRFLDAAHVKDVLALLRWIENPRARLAGFRAFRLLVGVGAATAARWLDALEAAADPGAMMRTGGVSLSIVRIWTDEVWVRRSFPFSK